MQVGRTVYAMILMRKCQFRESRFKKISEEDATRTSYLYERLKSYRAILVEHCCFGAVKNRIIEILFYYILIKTHFVIFPCLK
jgi:hypothetical protein